MLMHEVLKYWYVGLLLKSQSLESLKNSPRFWPSSRFLLNDSQDHQLSFIIRHSGRYSNVNGRNGLQHICSSSVIIMIGIDFTYIELMMKPKRWTQCLSNGYLTPYIREGKTKTTSIKSWFWSTRSCLFICICPNLKRYYIAIPHYSNLFIFIEVSLLWPKLWKFHQIFIHPSSINVALLLLKSIKNF